MSRIARWSLALVVGLLTLTATFGSVFAADRREPPPPPPPTAGSPLERAYQDERARLAMAEARLQRAGAQADSVQNLIAWLREHHKETAPLERALAAFRERLAAARHEWEQARDTLRAHAGFDDQGKVINADQARATVASAHASLEHVRRILDEAQRALAAALAAYRHDSAAPQLPAQS